MINISVRYVSNYALHKDSKVPYVKDISTEKSLKITTKNYKTTPTLS